MKAHVRHIATGGIVGPLALFLATVLANEGQTLLGLHLEKTALAVYLTPFLLGAAAILHAQIKLEADKIGKELGNMLGSLDLGGLFGGPPAPSSPIPPAPIVPSATGAGPAAPPPAPTAIIPPPPAP